MPRLSGRKPPEPSGRGYFSEDTIAAPASSFGGAIGIVRVSGPEAFSSLVALSRPGAFAEVSPRTMIRVRLRSPSGVAIDDALVVRFRGPDSYTGEDCVEYHLHGNPLIASTLMDTLVSLGIRRALPGEFSFRAVRNGKLTLSQAAGVADLVDANNSSALQMALEKLSGIQNRWISDLGESLRTLMMEAESAIDFSDQDLGETPLPRLKASCHEITKTLENLAATFARGSRIQTGIRVAFLGLPNAGKSSLFNSLLGEDRSIVSDIPGTTRDVVGEHLTLSSGNRSATFRLEDTAGLRATESTIESLGVQRSLRAAQDADLVLLVIDSANLQESLKAVETQWRGIGPSTKKFIVVLNKSDLITKDQSVALAKLASETFAVVPCVSCSAHNGVGVEALIERMLEVAEQWYRRDPGEYLLTRAEHLRAVQDTISHITRASNAVELDLFASDLRHALQTLAPLIGETVPDDILNAIFSRFCIGK